MYKKRLLESKVARFARNFKIVLLAGARQVGKSSLLAHLFPYQGIIFDPVQDFHNARQNPDLFLKNFPSPLILDEIQYAPELLPSLKRRVDQSDARGQYLMTGSQQLTLLKTIAESLAGRVGIIELGPMVPHEIYETIPQRHWLERYLNSPETFQETFAGTIKDAALYETLWRGGMPGILSLENAVLADYFSSYSATYVERDILIFEDIRELQLFGRFFALSGALTAQEVNYAHLGRDVGISPTTAQRWLSLLGRTYQWYEIPPYAGNTVKRISGKHKGFLRDTGIACYLQRISSPLALAGHPLLGALFETYCLHIIKTLAGTLSTQPYVYHWRTAGGAEVDCILELDGKLYPIEVKCKTTISQQDTRGIAAFRDTYQHKQVMPGIILYAGDLCFWVNEHTMAFPWNGI